MSELAKEIRGNWEGRPEGKMQYIHNAIKSFPIKNDTVKKIYNHFGAEIFRRSTVPLCYGDLFIEKSMNGKGIKTALEIGTWNGIPASIMAMYCDKVITIDIKDQPEKYELWDWLGISDKIEFHLVNNEAEKERLISKLDFDYCLMDGAHSMYTYSDWMMVRKCGRVLFHEYWNKQPPVMELVNSLPSEEVKRYRLPNGKGSEFAYWEKK